jgi:hypothetical protein
VTDLYDEAFVESLRLGPPTGAAATTAGLLRRGANRDRLGLRVKRGRLLRPYRGIYLSPKAGLVDRLHALQRALPPEAAFTMTTAATLYGFGVMSDPKVHIAVPAGTAVPQIAGVAAHETHRPPAYLFAVHGLRCVPPSRCAADLARALLALDGLPVLDAAVRSGRVRKQDLLTEISGHDGLRGVRQARRLIALADPRSPCRQETQLRLILADGGLPAPEPQFPVSDGYGVVRHRIDLAYQGEKVGVEYDGVSHLSRDRLRADRARHNWLAERGWTMRSFTDRDIYRDPERVVRTVAAALRSARGGATAGDPSPGPAASVGVAHARRVPGAFARDATDLVTGGGDRLHECAAPPRDPGGRETRA